MSARLGVLCPHSCLSLMVLHCKTYVLMLCAPFIARHLKCKIQASHRLWLWKCLQLRFEVNLCNIGKVRRSRNLTRYSVCDALTALKIAVINAKKRGYPCWMSNESTWFKCKCTLFDSCFGNCRRLAYQISAYEVCIICPKIFAACKIHCKSPSRRPDALT